MHKSRESIDKQQKAMRLIEGHYYWITGGWITDHEEWYPARFEGYDNETKRAVWMELGNEVPEDYYEGIIKIADEIIEPKHKTLR